MLQVHWLATNGLFVIVIVIVLVSQLGHPLILEHCFNQSNTNLIKSPSEMLIP